ncbi:MAG: hypothetical protein PUB34_07225 [Clostridia bacterium]|nr:hypothetical protein [Clostridia bacterium]
MPNKYTELYERFSKATTRDLEKSLLLAKTREEKIFYRKLLNLKLQLEQEKVIGEKLL